MDLTYRIDQLGKDYNNGYLATCLQIPLLQAGSNTKEGIQARMEEIVASDMKENPNLYKQFDKPIKIREVN